MKRGAGKLFSVGLTAAAAFGAYALLAPLTAEARRPKPPCPNCPPTLVINGVTCTLTDCGDDCVYVCPFPP